MSLTEMKIASKQYFHGSSTPGITELREGTYVTDSPEDATVFAVPWSSEEIDWSKTPGRGGGRPPSKLSFKRGVRIPDHPI